MKILDARWTPTVNMLRIQCECGKELEHRADRWMVKCPACRRVEKLKALRDQELINV